MSSFLPRQDSALLAWSLNFSTRINAAASSYGLTTLQATNYSAVHASFATALAACDPQERNQIATAAKNAARGALLNQARLLANLVQGTATVTDAQKLELGLTIRALPSPVPAPGVAPGVAVLSATGNNVKLRLFDTGNTTGRAKPPFVDGAAVFSFVGPAAPTSQTDWNFEGMASTTIFDVTFPAGTAPGTQVWFTAYWFNGRKQRGPASDPVSANVPGGAAMAA